MKRMLAIAVAVLLLFTSCGGEDREHETTKQTQESGSGEYGAMVYPDLTEQ